MQSVALRQQWEENAGNSIKQMIITYNRDDCEDIELVTHAVERVAIVATRPNQTDTNVNHADEVCVHSEDIQRVSKWRKFTSSIPALEAINEAAHWDYQRDRVYVRNAKTTGSRKRTNLSRTQLRPETPHLNLNKEAICSVPSRFPLRRG